MNNSTETVPSWSNANDEKEFTLKKWKKLHNRVELMVDSLMWTGHHKHPLEVLLWDLTKLISRLESEVKGEGKEIKITFKGSLTGKTCSIIVAQTRPDLYVIKMASWLGALWCEDVTYFYDKKKQDRVARYLEFDLTMMDTIKDVIDKEEAMRNEH